ncbi:MAG: hypothetical protein AAB557_00040 [Patescibacteria group bacterium]
MRNTYLLISILAVIAALMIGINIGRRFQSSGAFTPSPQPRITPTIQIVVPAVKNYRNNFCKVAFDYPNTFTVLENASGSAAFTGENPDDGIIITCQKDIPKPSVSSQSTEDIRIGSVAATLYHTQTASDGASIDSLIFRHPMTKLDVFLAGTGEVFRKLISSITLLP